MKGNGANIARIAPFSGIEFYTYEVAKPYVNLGTTPGGILEKLFCGAIAGFVATSITYPLEPIRTLLSMSNNQQMGGFKAPQKRAI